MRLVVVVVHCWLSGQSILMSGAVRLLFVITMVAKVSMAMLTAVVSLFITVLMWDMAMVSMAMLTAVIFQFVRVLVRQMASVRAMCVFITTLAAVGP